MCDTDIGALIRRQREKLGLTYEEIGKAVGVGKSTVRKWETGMIKNMRRDKIAALAKVLQVPPSALIDRDDYSSEEVRERMARLLKQYRERAGFTVDYVGEKIGKSGKTVSAWEHGRGQPDADMLLMLCELYGIEDINVFFGINAQRDISSNYSPAALEVAAAYDQADYPTQHAVRRVLSLPVNEPEILVRAAHRTTRSLDDINRPDTLED